MYDHLKVGAKDPYFCFDRDVCESPDQFQIDKSLSRQINSSFDVHICSPWYTDDTPKVYDIVTLLQAMVCYFYDYILLEVVVLMMCISY